MAHAASATWSRARARSGSPLETGIGPMIQPRSQRPPAKEPAMSVVRYSQRGPVAVIEVDSPPVNALGQGVREGLQAGLDQARDNPEVKAVVIICAGRTFIAG